MSPLRNNTHDEEIWVDVAPCESEHHLAQPRTRIPPMGTVSLPTPAGAASLIVFNANKDKIWQGYVPLTGKKLISINPDEQRVYYDDEEIPQCDRACAKTENDVKPAGTTNVMFIVLILFILILVLLFLRFRN